MKIRTGIELAVVAAASLWLGTPAMAQSLQILAPDCRAPEAPNIPDGASATEDQLGATQTKVKAYLADADEYVNCLEKAKTSLGDTIQPEQEHVLVSAQNLMVDTMHATGDMFNAAVKKYKARETN
ncbi:MAG: hypothetical protein AB7Q97_13690 [Gammaproteobacteria bacterium]